MIRKKKKENVWIINGKMADYPALETVDALQNMCC